jgi:hypothetical protein
MVPTSNRREITLTLHCAIILLFVYFYLYTNNNSHIVFPGTMRGSSAGTSVRGPQNQEGAYESLKDLIA